MQHHDERSFVANKFPLSRRMMPSDTIPTAISRIVFWGNNGVCYLKNKSTVCLNAICSVGTLPVRTVTSSSF